MAFATWFQRNACTAQCSCVCVSNFLLQFLPFSYFIIFNQKLVSYITLYQFIHSLWMQLHFENNFSFPTLWPFKIYIKMNFRDFFLLKYLFCRIIRWLLHEIVNFERTISADIFMTIIMLHVKFAFKHPNIQYTYQFVSMHFAFFLFCVCVCVCVCVKSCKWIKSRRQTMKIDSIRIIIFH